jgi:hypothetical protein
MKTFLFLIPFFVMHILGSTSRRPQCQSTLYLQNEFPTGWYLTVDSAKGNKLQLDKSRLYSYVDASPFISAEGIDKLEIIPEKTGDFTLKMKFTNKAAKIWERATDVSYRELRGLAFVVDGKLIYVGKYYKGKITDGEAPITREEYTKHELEEIVSKIRNGKKH